MSDSFFTSRNRYDDQVERFDAINCSELIEASTRRLVQLQGPASVAKAHYRLADICGGAHVLPVEFWRTAPAAPAPSKPEPARQSSAWASRLRAFWPVAVFWLGILVANVLWRWH